MSNSPERVRRLVLNINHVFSTWTIMKGVIQSMGTSEGAAELKQQVPEDTTINHALTASNNDQLKLDWLGKRRLHASNWFKNTAKVLEEGILALSLQRCGVYLSLLDGETGSAAGEPCVAMKSASCLRAQRLDELPPFFICSWISTSSSSRKDCAQKQTYFCDKCASMLLLPSGRQGQVYGNIWNQPPSVASLL